MSDETQHLGSASQSLDDLLAECIAAEESGRAIDADALAGQHPEHAAELREFLANRDQMRRLAEPLQGAAAAAMGRRNGQSLGKVRYFGDYELVDEIAAGGMGIVYKARQVSLNRIVAVKMILKGTLASEDDVKRFRAEAEAAANLQHPGIVAIHEVGLHEGQHYFSMDFVEGHSLAQLPREQPLSARQAAEYVRDAAEAVHYAHQQGTLHRDLKPSNVLIDRHNRVRITDFGLAKRIEDNSDLTLTGQILGTPSYMPPEQALGKRSLIGTASDVYSLGAVLYELLTGRPPFRGESPGETLRQVETLDPVSPRLLSPAAPRDLETICLKCLEKEPHKRYLTAQHLADDLGRFLRHEPILARPITRRERAWRWCRRNPVVAGLTAMVLLLLVIVSVSSSVG
jgi:serine/threonine protein kinase